MSNTPDIPSGPLSTPPATPQPAAVPIAANPASAAPRPPAKKEEGIGDASLAEIIDTIEAIIIALIVALTFRAFIVEAFVIPTGSMGPTLDGAHYKVICPDCGYEYDLEANINYQLVKTTQGPQIVGIQHAELQSNKGVPLGLEEGTAREKAIVCPNCRYEILPSQLPQYLVEESKQEVADTRPPSTRRRVPFVWANNGDRILVLKYLYSVMEPSRWDVIVFKEPKQIQDNYIKRLIGLPGETLEIVNGDVFIQPDGDQNPADFQIARKPEHLQSSLWQLVYNNDYYPISALGAKPNDLNPRSVAFSNPWESAQAWTKGPVMKYDGPGPSTLKFNLAPPQTIQSRLPGQPSSAYTLNTLGYNNDFFGTAGEGTPRSYVGDLRLETLWSPVKETLPKIELTLGRPSDCYRVSWSAAGLRLFRYNPATQAFDPVDGAAITDKRPESGKSYQLAFNNVDRAVQFYIDGTKVISYEQPWTVQQAIDDETQNPSLSEVDAIAFKRPGGHHDAMIQIEVADRCSLAHLKLFRDLYYTQVLTGIPGEGYQLSGTGTQAHPIHLGRDEFFAMGDNSRKSSDSRFWDFTFDAAGDLGLRNGVVPRRYLLGKAFFVYWPAGYRLPILSDYPLVPDAGDMRVIR